MKKIVVACGNGVATSQSVAYIEIMKTDKTYDIPTINGIAFLSGENIDEEFSKLVEIINNS